MNLEEKKQLNKTHKTLVLVTNQYHCESIIKAGRLIADLTKTDLTVVSTNDPQYPHNPQALEKLFQVSSDNNAVMTVLYTNDPSKSLMSYIKNSKTSNIITGMPHNEESVVYKMRRKFTHIKFFTVNEIDEVAEFSHATQSQKVS